MKEIFICDSCAEKFNNDIDLQAHLFNNKHCTPPIHSDPTGEGNKDFTGMPIVSSRVDHIPPIPSWDEIFTIQNNGIPQGTKNMFKIYFNPPTRKSVALPTPQTGREELIKFANWIYATDYSDLGLMDGTKLVDVYLKVKDK